MRKYLILIIACFFMLSCNRSLKTRVRGFQNAGNMKEVAGDAKIIDLDRVETMSAEQFASMVVDIRYISLEMGIVPVGAVNDIFINDKYIALLDGQKSKSIFIYDRSGKLVCLVKARGHGRGEYLEPSSVEITTKPELLCVKDDRQGKFLYYDMKGKFVKEENTIASVHALHLGKYVLNQLAVGQTFDKDCNYHLLVSKKDSVISKGLPYSNIQLDNFVSNKFDYNSNGDLLYQPFASDTIYQILGDSYSPRYIFKNKKSLWKLKDEKLSFKEVTQRIKIQGMNRVSSFHEGKDFIFYSIYSFAKENGSIVNIPYLYDKAKGVSYRVMNIPKGEIKLFAPLDVLCVYGDWCVGLFNPYALKIQMGSDYYVGKNFLGRIIANSSVESNPVLAFYKLR